MDRKSTFIIVSLLLFGVVFFLGVSFIRNGSDNENGTSPAASTTEWMNVTTEKKEILITPKTTVTAKHAYQKGTHSIAGDLPLPNPCYILDASAHASDDKKQIFVEFVSSTKTDEMCAEVITTARFKVSIKALRDAKITGMFNGQEIVLNLIEAMPDENLDNFELYIKG